MSTPPLTMTDLDWKPFSLTFVEYPKGDTIGKFLAISSLAPVAIVIGFVTLILFRRDLHTIMFFAGALLNEVINLVLKNIIAEPRPVLRGGLYTEYGMPSSHSQMMWFFTVYSILFLIFRLRHISNSVMELLWKVLVAVALVTAAFIVMFSRVYLLYHSWSQVLWGALLGILLGCGWFTLTHLVLTPLFPVIASWHTQIQIGNLPLIFLDSRVRGKSLRKIDFPENMRSLYHRECV
ncbi:dolichyldiphosphatase 1-like isoform X2 [Homarus americanus]|uniref:dolichyldiphosphatase 1-like isoform X2 n=1 Tax=Homarus americanus TaxID=6706 RepID=UPI001C446C96|nr:dolichyldiphosphatase 1-like isoform X2 [Homarus americanus]